MAKVMLCGRVAFVKRLEVKADDKVQRILIRVQDGADYSVFSDVAAITALTGGEVPVVGQFVEVEGDVTVGVRDGAPNLTVNNVTQFEILEVVRRGGALPS